MISKRRRGPADSAIRGELISAAERIIQTEGVHAVTAGRLANLIGLKRQIVHYYFESIDDLLAAVIRQSGERLCRDLEQKIASGAPMAAVLDTDGNPAGTIASFEMIAVALRKARLRDEIRHYSDAFVRLQAEAFGRHFAERGITPAVSPATATVVLAAVSQAIITHRAIGVENDQSEALALINRMAREYLENGVLSDAPRLAMA